MLSSNIEPIIVATFLYYLPGISKIVQAFVFFIMCIALRVIYNTSCGLIDHITCN